MGIAGVEHDPHWLTVRFTDGTSHRFLAAWLRDNVVSGRHRAGGQRTFDINALPEVTISRVAHTEAEVLVSFAPETREEVFPEPWLRDRFDAPRIDVPPPTHWGSGLRIRVLDASA